MKILTARVCMPDGDRPDSSANVCQTKCGAEFTFAHSVHSSVEKDPLPRVIHDCRNKHGIKVVVPAKKQQIGCSYKLKPS